MRTRLAASLWAVFLLLPTLALGESHWLVEARDVALGTYRQRLVVTSSDEVWLGGGRDDASAGPLLYRRRGSGSDPGWEAVSTPFSGRSFVLATDPEGVLRIASYLRIENREAPASPYQHGLRIHAYDGRSWWEEEVEEGIWPQAMAMSSAEEGWIGGNRGWLLHRQGDGTWRRRCLWPAETEKRCRPGWNILDLAMTADGSMGWAVGSRGLVARYGSGAWEVVADPGSAERPEGEVLLWAVAPSPDGRRFWAAGEVMNEKREGVILYFDGEHWHWHRPGCPRLNGLAMVSPREGWAVGDHATLLRYDGRSWRPWKDLPYEGDFFDIVFDRRGEGALAAGEALLRLPAESSTPPRLQEVSRRWLHGEIPSPVLAAAAADLDEDGFLDLAVLETGALWLLRNAEGTSFFRRLLLPLPQPGEELPPLSTFALGDVDGDDDLDLYLQDYPTRLQDHHHVGGRLYRNRGGFDFEEILDWGGQGMSGLEPSAHFLDLDRDGHLDLYLTLGGRDNPLLWNDGRGHFEVVPTGTGLAGAEKCTLWGDLNGDLEPDLLLLGYSPAESFLYLNRGAGRLVEGEEETARLRECLGRSEGPYRRGLLLDLEPDGDLDLVTVGGRPLVLANDGRGGFTPAPDVSGPDLDLSPHDNHALASAAGDLDRDGLPEILLQAHVDGRPAPLLLTRGDDGIWRDAAAEYGLAGLDAGAILFADWDGDGDLDLFTGAARAGGRSRVFLNLQSASEGLRLHLSGSRSDRRAVGTRVRIFPSGERAVLGHRQLGLGQDPSGVVHTGVLEFPLPPGAYDLEVSYPGAVPKRLTRMVKAGEITEVDLPELGRGPRRGAVLLGRAAARAWRSAEPVDLGWLTAGVLLLVWVRGPAARRLEARLLLPRKRFTLVLAAAYLAALGSKRIEIWPGPHPFAVLLLVAAAVATADSWLSRLRQRHLGPYRLQEELGRGGMGVVYRARDVVRRKSVALKILAPDLIKGEEQRRRFLREAEVLRRLTHPNIVRVLGSGEIEGQGYIAMELLSGETLAERLARPPELEIEAVASIAEAVLDALEAIHALSIVHRDVKGENIFLLDTRSESGGRALWRRRTRLMDFGLARADGMPRLGRRRTLIGTLAYLAPEQVRGERADHRVDLFALGVVLYQALGGRHPFASNRGGNELALLRRIGYGEAEPLRRLRPQLPAALEAVVRKLLAKDPRHRYHSASAALAALVEAGEGRGGEPLPAGGESASPADSSYGVGGFAQSLSRRPAAVAAGEVAGSPESEGWRTLYRRARLDLAAGRRTAAEVAMLECIDLLRRFLGALDAEERRAYARRHGVAEVLEFYERMEC